MKSLFTTIWQHILWLYERKSGRCIESCTLRQLHSLHVWFWWQAGHIKNSNHWKGSWKKRCPSYRFWQHFFIYLVKTSSTNQCTNRSGQKHIAIINKNQHKTTKSLKLSNNVSFHLDYPSFIYCGLAMFCQIKNLQWMDKWPNGNMSSLEAPGENQSPMAAS